MWQCPVCQRLFVREESVHTCKKFNEADLLLRKTPNAVELYQHVKEYLLSMQNVVALPVSYGLEFMVNRRFVTILVYKNHLKLIFTLIHPVDEFPIDHHTQMSKNRFVHVVDIECIDEFDDQIKSWLTESYQSVGLNL